MMKAYDRVSWVFLVNVLRAFGFGERWIDMVWRLVSNPWFSVLINGMPRDFFPASWGLRQGDPLSPSLFILGAEVLSRLLNQLQLHPGFCGFKVHRINASGQSINAANIGFMVYSTMPRGRRAAIHRITGFSQKVFPVRYLGFPLFVG